MAKIITLTTDFGLRDHFVGSMKGVILGINPEVLLIDISHEVEAQSVESAAYQIYSSFRYFPQGTIHLAIVDPGVGSSRRPILVVGEKHFFIGPDNGIFGYIYPQIDKYRVIHITAEEYFLKPVWQAVSKPPPALGSTFHGRDLFAPVAGWLSKGVAPDKFGKEILDAERRPPAEPNLKRSGSGARSLKGKIIYIDRFGNLISNITPGHLELLAGPNKSKHLEIKLKGDSLPFKRYYAEGSKGRPSALINSCGHLEVFVYLGNAQKKLKASLGDPIHLRSES